MQLWDGVKLEDDVFVGPNVTFTNDPFPRSEVRPEAFARTIVKKGASIGGNATVLPGLTIGRGAMVGAGSVVTKDVADFAKVFGNPARIRGYVHTESSASSSPSEQSATASEQGFIDIDGVRMITLVRAVDLRGSLVAGEQFMHIPLTIERFFLVFDVPSAEVRGERHRERSDKES